MIIPNHIQTKMNLMTPNDEYCGEIRSSAA